MGEALLAMGGVLAAGRLEVKPRGRFDTQPPMSIPRPRALVLAALLAASLPRVRQLLLRPLRRHHLRRPRRGPLRPPFEVVLLDDQPDPFATLDPPLPAGISSFQEPVIFSPEDIQERTYVRLVIQPGETLAKAMARAKPWFDARKLPPGERFVFSQIVEENEHTKQREAVGVRTYVATNKVLLTKDDVATATVGAVPDKDNKPQPVALVQLNPIAAERFRDDTRKNVFRRLAVMTHGNVLMAPLIQDEIAGGKLTIGADPDLPYDLKRSELQRLVDAIKPPAPAASK